MIRFTVVWHQEALDQLANTWTRSIDRRGITRASNTIDSVLAQDAHLKGDLILHGLRDITVSPLRVLFEVSEPDRIARILRVGLIQRE